MINLDTRVLDKVNENELWLILHVAKRMQSNRMTAWPSMNTLVIDTRWQENTVRKYRKSLCDKGFLEIEYRDNQSPIYRFTLDGIGVFTQLSGSFEEAPPSQNLVPEVINNGSILTTEIVSNGNQGAPNGAAFVVEIYERHVETVFSEPQEKSPARARASKPDRHSADDVARELSGPHLDFYCDILNTGVWADYLDYRKEIRVKPYRSAKSEAQAIMDFFKEAGGDSSKSQEIVNQSRAKGWTGLFKLKNSNNDRNGTNQVRHSTNPGNGGDFYGGGDNPMWSGVMQGDTGEWGKKYP